MTWEYRELQEVTGGYKGLQGVTGGDKGLQGVTRGDRGWQGVTGGDKGLQEVSKNYRNFFLTRTFPETFSWSIFHKNESWRNLKFLTNTMDPPLWKNSNFAFFVHSCFFSLWRLLFYLERQQTLFLDVFLIKTKDEKTSTFWPKSSTNPFAKMPILWVLETDLFVVQKRLFAI